MFNWFKKKEKCPTCDGTGAEVFYFKIENALWDVDPLALYSECSECEGKGKILVVQPK